MHKKMKDLRAFAQQIKSKLKNSALKSCVFLFYVCKCA